MKTLNQLEQEAQQAREEAIKEVSKYVPNAIEVTDKLIRAVLAQAAFDSEETRLINERVAKMGACDINENQLSILRDIFDSDDDWVMRHVSIKLLGNRNIILEIDNINDCDYKELEKLKQEEASQDQKEVDDDGWITWNGDGHDCPMSENVRIEARFANGDINGGDAGQYRWNHVGNGYDLIAYRIVK